MADSSARAYKENVFINCPFDAAYDTNLRAIVFSVVHCGFRARCALEIDDAAEVRIEKLFRIIEECQFGVHDLSRTQLDRESQLPRFNMPLELGMFLAARRFGSRKQKQKNCLVLDSEPFRYQAFISDIAGQDIRSHHNEIPSVITLVRNWLRTSSGNSKLPGGTSITRRFEKFIAELPKMCSKTGLETNEITFADYSHLVSSWLRGSS